MEQYANNAQTVLSADIDSTTTTLTVSSVFGFPTTGQFRIRIDNEIILVTAISRTSWTIVRAVEPTGGIQTASDHVAGTGVYLVLTVQSLFAVPATQTVWNEIPSGLINGSNVTFTVAAAPAQIILFLNGLLQTDYTVSTNIITLTTAPHTGDTLVACYIK